MNMGPMEMIGLKMMSMHIMAPHLKNPGSQGGISYNTDWQPTTKAKENSHGTEVSSGDLFGSTIYTDSNDSYPPCSQFIFSDMAKAL